MDSRLKAEVERCEVQELGSGSYFNQGFQFAIQRLRENEYYGHYAQFLATWLEKHTVKEVKSDRATDK